MRFAFDDFVLDTETYTLTRCKNEVQVELRILETLALLIRERGRVISKEELLETVWDVEFASEATLFKAIQQARKALGDDGRSQRFIKTVHGKGYRFIVEVEQESDETPQAVRQNDEIGVAGERTPEPSRVLRRWWLIPAGAALLVLLGLAWVLSRSTSTGGPPVRTSVALLHCVADPSLTGDESWMPDAVPELLFLRLRSFGGLRLLAEDEVAKAERDLGALSGREQRQRILDRLACDIVISTRLSHRGAEGLRLEAMVLRRDDLDSPPLVRNDPDGDLFNLAGELGADITRQLVGREGTASDSSWTPEVPPEIFATYVLGVHEARDGHLSVAVSELAPLVAQHPRFTMARIALAKVYQSMGLKEAASLEARTALDFADDLSAEVRLQLEALILEIDGRWGEAARVYRSLWSVAPDEVEYPLSLIRALRWDGQSNEAVEVSTRVGQALQDDPRLHLELSRAAQIQGERGLQRASLQEARATAEARGATGRLASALLGLGWVDLSDGEFSSAESHIKQAEALFRSIGNQRGIARCFKAHATSLSYGPQPELSLPLFDKAAQLQRERGDFEDLAKTLYSTTSVLAFMGDFNGALIHGHEALEIARKTGDREVEGAILVRIADAQVDLGRPEDALPIYHEALAVFEDQGATRRIAGLYNSMGLACEFTGDLAAASRHFRRSSEMWQEIGDSSSWFNAAYNLAWLMLRAGDLDEAASWYESLRTEQSDSSEEAAVHHLAAGIAYEEGDFERAQVMIDQAIDLRESIQEGAALESSRALRRQIRLVVGFDRAELDDLLSEIPLRREAGDLQGLATALMTAAEALGQANRWREASVYAEEAISMTETSASPQLLSSTNIVGARVDSHVGRFEQAGRRLDQARQAAERSGLAMLVMEAEIVMAELQLKKGQGEEARADLTHLQRQAEGRSWGRLAAQAESTAIQ